MNESLREYIQSLLPANLPDGRKLLEEGRALGKTIQVPRTPFLEKHGCKSYLEYRKKRLAEGKQTWQLLLGLATLEDEIAGIKEIDAFNRRHAADGMEISDVQSIPAQIVGLPREYWDGFPQRADSRIKETDTAMGHSFAEKEPPPKSLGTVRRSGQKHFMTSSAHFNTQALTRYAPSGKL